MPKVLILILSTTDQRYQEFITACKNTWVQRAEQSFVDCIFYQGGAPNDILELNELKLAVDDSLGGTGIKLFRALEYIERFGIEYDYIYRTNLSSYIFMDNFINWTKTIANEDLYAGVVIQANMNDRWPYRFMRRLAERFYPENHIPFASGAGFCISRKNVQLMLADAKLDLRWVDDVMVGECLYRHGIKIVPVSRIDFNGDSISYHANASGKIKQMEHCFHIRCRSKDRARDAARFYELDGCANYTDFENLLIT